MKKIFLRTILFSVLLFMNSWCFAHEGHGISGDRPLHYLVSHGYVFLVLLVLVPTVHYMWKMKQERINK